MSAMIGMSINGLSMEGNTQAESVMRFINTQQVLVSATRVTTPSSTFLQVEGAESARIVVDGGDLSYASKAVVHTNGSTEKAVKLRT